MYFEIVVASKNKTSIKSKHFKKGLNTTDKGIKLTVLHYMVMRHGH